MYTKHVFLVENNSNETTKVLEKIDRWDLVTFGPISVLFKINCNGCQANLDIDSVKQGFQILNGEIAILKILRTTTFKIASTKMQEMAMWGNFYSKSVLCNIIIVFSLVFSEVGMCLNYGMHQPSFSFFDYWFLDNLLVTFFAWT